MGRTNNLLRTIPETRKHLESIRGKHRRSGKVWYPNLLAHLGDPDEGSPRWWDKAEFLALASIYCERRNRGHEMYLEGAVDLFKLLTTGGTTLSPSGRYRMYRLLACPLLLSRCNYYSFCRYPSRNDVENGYRNIELAYPTPRLMWFFGKIHPDITAAGHSLPRGVHDCMVTAWMEFHKEIWSTDPENYTYNMTMTGWDNAARDTFIRELIESYDSAKSDSYRDHIPTWLGSDPLTVALPKAVTVINELADHLAVRIPDLETERIFEDFLDGSVDADELPGHVQVWEGLRDTEFVTSINAILQKPRLLNLVSPTKAARTLMGGRAEQKLLVDLLLQVMTDKKAQLFLQTLGQQGYSWDLVPQGGSYKFQHWDDLVCFARGYYHKDPNPEANEKLLGIKAFLLDIIEPNRVIHSTMVSMVRDWIRQAEGELDKLLGNNKDHIKAVKRLFDKVSGAALSKDEKQRSRRARRGHYDDDTLPNITLDHFEIPNQGKVDFRVPTMARCLLKDMEKQLRVMVSEKMSDLVDGDWKVLTTMEINFDD
jgi:hypothetical protein